MTTGRVYQTVIQRERNLEYEGKCVEVVPHVPNEVIRRIDHVAKTTQADFVLIEIGGTVGEYQNILFLEALRFMKLRDPELVRTILVSYLPVPPSIGEMKTKPTQHAVREVHRAGILPDFLIARSEHDLDEPRRVKLSQFCNVPVSHIIAAPNVSSIYEIPLVFDRQKFGDAVLRSFGMRPRPTDLSVWNRLAKKLQTIDKRPVVRIGVIGKYFGSGSYVLSDVYLSVLEAIKHASWSLNYRPEIHWIHAEQYEKNPNKLRELKEFDGILVPGGFGSRGIEGKIAAIEYARKNKIPFFGICYGMQCAVIEFARHVLKLKTANSTEMKPQTKDPVIHLMEGQASNVAAGSLGGTLRLGSYPCNLTAGTKTAKAYGTKDIMERHRHRYEYNNAYREQLEAAGLRVAGASPDGNLVEIVELEQHPFFVGVQFHPEFQSRPLSPHPLFRAFVQAAIEQQKA